MDPTLAPRPDIASTYPPFTAINGRNIKVNDIAGMEVDPKYELQPKPARKRKAQPYRREEWKLYERVSVLKGSRLDFVSTTKTPNSGKQARHLVRSEVMKNYHAKRRDASKESQQINFSIQKTGITSWRGDPFIKFPVELTLAIKEFLDCGLSTFPFSERDLM
jgi:hypothetical protein